MNQQELTQRLTTQALLAAMALLFWYLLTSCSPYVGSANLPTLTPTPSPSATVTGFQKIENPTPTPRPVCYVTGYLNFRTSPSRQGAVIRVLEAGERVTVLERGDWLKVSTGGKSGFIYSKFCK